LAALLPRARLAIHHGGLDMANWWLTHRVPQAIFPTDLETLFVGRGVEQAKAGKLFGTRLSPNAFADALRQLADQSVSSHPNEGMQTTPDGEMLQALLSSSRVVRSL